MDDIMRGIFPVLQTAVRADGELDLESMKKQVDFCIECGGHGLVFPASSSI
jgi:dihydrodipicolinate synthase/N-acetylneuraminate lyase